MRAVRFFGPVLVAAGLLTACLTAGDCRAETLSSNYIGAPITVDGRFDEWLDLPGKFYSDPMVALCAANDSARLYLHLRTSDDQVAQLIRMSGITLYLDRKGGKGKDFFVRYCGGPAGPTMKTGQEPGGKDARRPEGRRGESDLDQPGADDSLGRGPEFTCFQKDRIIEKPIPADGSSGAAAAYAFQEGFH